MRTTVAMLATLLIVGVLALGLQAITVGIGVGYEITGLVLIGCLTEVPIGEHVDVRAQIGFATPGITGLMLISMDALAHWPVPPLDPFVGLGAGVALTPPPYSTGMILEAVGGLRLAPTEIVQLYLQARYILRRADGRWSDGPIFEGGLLLRF